MIDSWRRVVAVTAVLTGAFVLSVFVTDGPDPARPVRDVALVALNTLPLLGLRRNPLLVVLTCCVAYPLWLMTGHDAHLLQSMPTLVALYALGAWSRPARAGAGAGGVVPGNPTGTVPGDPTGTVPGEATGSVTGGPRPLWLRAIGLVAPVWAMTAVLLGWWQDDPYEIGYVAIMFALGWALGVVIADRRSYILRLEARTDALRRARRELADRAVADERARIARELHDIVAHAMSVITVRAGVGAHLADTRPAEAAEALRVIEGTGREALTEMRRMLAVLREPQPESVAGTDGFPGAMSEPDGAVPKPRDGIGRDGIGGETRERRHQPRPGLADLPALVARTRAAGVPVAVTTGGEPALLPAGLDLAAYRVVQEALTNVVKHVPGARAELTLRHLPGSVVIEVRNPGPIPAPVSPGQGLRGMAERVALYGGDFTAGQVGDGFRVRVELPVETHSPLNQDDPHRD